MNKKLIKVLKISNSAFVCITVVFALLLVGVRLFGLQVFTVLSPSMEPDYPTGSLVYVKAVDSAMLKVNDVITFRLSGSTTATHRIIELVPDENDPETIRFRTKGDNNAIADTTLVEYQNVIGKVIFCVPLLGYIAMYIQHPPGMFIVIALGVTILLVMFLIEYITNEKKKTSDSI